MLPRLLLLIFTFSLVSVAAHAADKEAALRQDYPLVEGHYQMTKVWAATLTEKYNQRFEGDNLVLWRPGVTMWFSVFQNEQKETPEARLNRIMADVPAEAFDQIVQRGKALTRYSYYLPTGALEGREAALHCFAIGKQGRLQMSAYSDDPEELSLAMDTCRSLTETLAENR